MIMQVAAWVGLSGRAVMPISGWVAASSGHALLGAGVVSYGRGPITFESCGIGLGRASSGPGAGSSPESVAGLAQPCWLPGLRRTTVAMHTATRVTRLIRNPHQHRKPTAPAAPWCQAWVSCASPNMTRVVTARAPILRRVITFPSFRWSLWTKVGGGLLPGVCLRVDLSGYVGR